jgi:hypothetical protein
MLKDSDSGEINPDLDSVRISSEGLQAPFVLLESKMLKDSDSGKINSEGLRILSDSLDSKRLEDSDFI